MGTESIEARYAIAGPGGSWDAADAQGTYTIRSRANQVTDIVGNALPVRDIGTFVVTISPEVCGAGRLRGDVNGDNAVNFRDFLILGGNFGRTVGAAFESGDLDCDGAVLFSDFLILSQTFGDTA